MGNTWDFIIQDGTLTKYVGTKAHVVIPEGIHTIGKEAFRNCQSLISLTVPESVITIEECAFLYCINLTNVTLPGGVTFYGEGAFSWCVSLTDLTIAPGAEHNWMAWDDLFGGCCCLTRIMAPGISLRHWPSIHHGAALAGYLMHSDQYSDSFIVSEYQDHLYQNAQRYLSTLFARDLVKGLAILDEKGLLEEYLFEEELLQPATEVNAQQCIAFLMDWQNRHTSSVLLSWDLEEDPNASAFVQKRWVYKTLPDGTLCITDYKGMETSIEIPAKIQDATVSAIGPSAFDPYKTDRPIKRQELLKRLETVIIPDTVKTIGNYAFANCISLTSVLIPEGVSEINNSAFARCIRLPEIVLPHSLRHLGKCAFEQCTRLSSVTIPQGIEQLYERTFAQCKNLICVLIPDTVQVIGDHTFQDCNRLDRINIPGQLTFLGNFAFDRCSSLCALTLPHSLETIGDYAFFGCEKLHTVTFNGSATFIGVKAFEAHTTIQAPTLSWARIYAEKNCIPYQAI